MTIRQFGSFEEAMEWEQLQQEQLKKIITPEQWTLADGKTHYLFYVANGEVELARVLSEEEYLSRLEFTDEDIDDGWNIESAREQYAELRSRGYVHCEVFSQSYPKGEYMDVHVVKTLPLPARLWGMAVACKFQVKMMAMESEFLDLLMRWGRDVQVKG